MQVMNLTYIRQFFLLLFSFNIAESALKSFLAGGVGGALGTFVRKKEREMHTHTHKERNAALSLGLLTLCLWYNAYYFWLLWRLTEVIVGHPLGTCL